MKKHTFISVLISAAVALAVGVASFAAGCTLSADGSKPTGKSAGAEGNTPDSPKQADNASDEVTEPEEEEDLEKDPADETAFFFSPYTGDDENGAATREAPVKTKEQAEKIAKAANVDGDIIYLEYLMTVDVKTQQAYGVFSDKGGVNMIPFTGSADGHYFKGEIEGTGCDTQKYLPDDGGVLFSARYLLKGIDLDGQSCSIFIENNGTALDLCTPTIITDSRALSEWQDWELRSIVIPVGGGVEVNVFRIYRD